MLEHLKAKVYDVLVDLEVTSTVDRLVTTCLLVLIFANGLAVMLETVERINSNYSSYLYIFEGFSVGAFTLEYILRIWAVTLNPKYKKPLSGRVRYALTPLALVDLVAILPFYLPIALTIDLRMLRLLRLFRVFRLFKMTRYVESIRTFHNVFRAKKTELMVTAALIFLLLIFASSAMYAVEHDAQPEKFSSIPETLWWGVITLTTIGYGDVYPVTSLGKIIGGVIAFLGIGLFALPTGILASGFAEELQKRKDKH